MGKLGAIGRNYATTTALEENNCAACLLHSLPISKTLFSYASPLPCIDVPGCLPFLRISFERPPIFFRNEIWVAAAQLSRIIALFLPKFLEINIEKSRKKSLEWATGCQLPPHSLNRTSISSLESSFRLGLIAAHNCEGPLRFRWLP